MRDQGRQLGETTNLRSLSAADAVEQPGGAGSLQSGTARSRDFLLEVWRDDTQSQNEWWAEKAKQEQRDKDTAALISERDQVVAARAKAGPSSALASWCPPREAMAGDERTLITKAQYADVLATHSGKELEKAWRDQFNGVVGMEGVLRGNAAVGPQRRAEEDAAAAAAATAAGGTSNNNKELTDHAVDLCIHRGNCDKFGRVILSCGLIITTHICRFLRGRGGVAKPATSRGGGDAPTAEQNADANSPKGCDMLAVMELIISDSNHTVTAWALTAHANFSPYRVVLWRASAMMPLALRQGRLTFNGGIPDFVLVWQFLSDLPIDWRTLVDARVLMHEFTCIDWVTFQVNGCGAVEYNGMNLSGEGAPRTSLELDFASQSHAVTRLLLRGGGVPARAAGKAHARRIHRLGKLHASMRGRRGKARAKAKVKSKPKAATPKAAMPKSVPAPPKAPPSVPPSHPPVPPQPHHPSASSSSLGSGSGSCTGASSSAGGASGSGASGSGGVGSEGGGGGVDGGEGESASWMNMILESEDKLKAAKKKLSNSSKPSGEIPLHSLEPRWTNAIDFRFVETVIGEANYKWMFDNAHAIMYDPRIGEHGQYHAMWYPEKLKSGKPDRKHGVALQGGSYELTSSDDHMVAILTIWEHTLLEAVAAYEVLN